MSGPGPRIFLRDFVPDRPNLKIPPLPHPSSYISTRKNDTEEVLCAYCQETLEFEDMPAARTCGSCLSWSYCGRLCQQRHWNFNHSGYCVNRDASSEAHSVNMAVDAVYWKLFLAFTIGELSLRDLATIPEEADRKREWTHRSQSRFLHVVLNAVSDPPTERYNRASFASAKAVSMDRLPATQVAVLREQLVEQFPAVCLGYTYCTNDPTADSESAIITTTVHRFRWPQDPGKCLGFTKEGLAAIVADKEAKISGDQRESDARTIADFEALNCPFNT